MKAPAFHLDPEGLAVMLRCVLGLTSISAACAGFAAVAGALMIGAVWSDAVTGWISRRRRPKSESTRALERYADAACFVASPVALALACAGPAPTLVVMCAAFVVAAVYRMARFDVEGLRDGFYAGLPVTYNGYVFPVAALAALAGPGWASLSFFVAMVSTSVLMVSRQLKFPEF